MNVQELERDADLRIKFASIKDDGTYEHDAGEEYNCLFAAMPEGWECTPETVETRPAWRLSHEETQLGAIGHESGIEFLATLVAGTASSVASTAIVALATWAWARWKKLRVSKPLEPSLVLERVTERSLDGRPSVLARQELRGPLEKDTVGKSIEIFLQGALSIPGDQIVAGKPAKLAVTAILLAAFEIITLSLLLWNGNGLAQNGNTVEVFGLSLYRPWWLASLGGILGGTTRALYAFLVHVRAFEIKRVTGHPTSRRSSTASGQAVDDDFDWMHIWYLYLIKPFVGAAIGFLFALLIQFGLVPFVLPDSQHVGSGTVLVSGLAGIFAEDAIGTFRSLFRNRE